MLSYVAELLVRGRRRVGDGKGRKLVRPDRKEARVSSPPAPSPFGTLMRLEEWVPTSADTTLAELNSREVDRRNERRDLRGSMEPVMLQHEHTGASARSAPNVITAAARL